MMHLVEACWVTRVELWKLDLAVVRIAIRMFGPDIDNTFRLWDASVAGEEERFEMEAPIRVTT